jgi:hypothetical protein
VRKGALLKALVGALAAVVLAAPTAGAATLSLSPTSGTAGASVQARGTGFGKKLSGSVDFGVTPVATFRTNPKGVFSATFRVPSGYSGSVSVTARTAAAAASASFNVTGAPPPPPPPGGDPVIAGAGDIAGDSNDGEPTARLLDSIAPTIVYTLGDNAYESGTSQQYQDYYDPTWGRHKAKTKPAPGNHEYQTPGGAGYFQYFNPLQSYYSYNLGNWHLISLNGEISHSRGSAQELFLQSDLAANAGRCTLAYWHEPRFTSGSVHGNDTSFDAFWQDLYAARAEVVLNGHNHNYERFALQNPQGQADSNGIREFVAGTGGRSHYGFTTPKANSQVRNADTFGVLKMTLHPSSYDWQFVPIAGQTFTDSGTTTCHSGS